MSAPALFEEMSGAWPGRPSSVACARGRVRDWLRQRGLDAFEDSCLLVVSELATNAVMHAQTPFGVTVTELTDGLLVRVDDGSEEPPGPASLPALSAHSGRGMLLVDVVSESWGVLPREEGGKETWALLARPAVVSP